MAGRNLGLRPVVSKVSDLAVYALNDNAAPGGGVSSSIALVAGACNHRYRQTLRVKI
jgi:hypothetical protein